MSHVQNLRGAPFPIVVVGHVDHGKSTLIGRLLHDTNALPDGKLEELRRAADKRGGVFEWSFALDALQLERDQAITVDSTQIWFRTPKRNYLIIDAPGHREFLRNMVSGASLAEAGIILVDVVQGVTEQTKRHAYLLKLLGISRAIVAVNKMDLAGYDESKFVKVRDEIAAYLTSLGLALEAVVPIAARQGDNLAGASANMSWWSGPHLLAALDNLPHRVASAGQPLRLPVQDVYRRGEERVLVGRVEAGTLSVGDAVTVWPTQQQARVVGFESWNVDAPVLSASAGQHVAFRIDSDLFIERGHLFAAPAAAPQASRTVRARLFWLAREPLRAGRRLTLKVSTATYDVVVQSIDQVIDVNDLSPAGHGEIGHNDIGYITLRAERPVVHDIALSHGALARGVLADKFDVVGGCLIEPGREAAGDRNITTLGQSVSADERARRNGHAGEVLWLTGLSGAGKSTLAMAVQRALFDAGRQVFVLDGDNLRAGLNHDLGFDDKDRTENIRRTAAVARLMADAGLTVIVSLITPTEAQRRQAREIVGAGFHLLFVDAPLETCQARDPKGLYAKAAAGRLAQMTGLSSAWERPQDPNLRLDSAGDSLVGNVDAVVAYLRRRS